MRRIEVEQRPNATRLVQSQGLVYSTDPPVVDLECSTEDLDEAPAPVAYWPDDRYFSFTSAEIKLIEEAGKDVFDMCCEAGDYLVEHPEVITSRMAIPDFAVAQIRESWNRETPWGSVYGRFDFRFGGLDHSDPDMRRPLFYEFNADTPTSLVEAASVQWHWLEQTGHGNDQYNSMAERLVAAWRRNMPHVDKAVGHSVTVYFAVSRHDSSGEDAMNCALLMDTCRQAGWRTRYIFVEDISMGRDGRFYDRERNHIDAIFKLYPWEFMVDQDFGKACFRDMETVGRRDAVTGAYTGGTVWIEPPYKMLWSNKALFAILWKLFRNDPRSRWLLPTYFSDEVPAELTDYARKPIFSREGWGVQLCADGAIVHEQETDMYGAEGYIVQALAVPAAFEDGKGQPRYAVPGLWMIDGEPAGMGIREDATPITANASVFVPHSISDGPVRYHRRPVPTLEEIDSLLIVDRHAVVKDDHGVLEYIEGIIGQPSDHGSAAVPAAVIPTTVVQPAAVPTV